MITSLATRDYSPLCTITADGSWILYWFTNTLSITGIQTLMYTCKLCVKCRSHEFFKCLDHEFWKWENSAKSKASPFGKFAPKEKNPLNGISSTANITMQYTVLLCNCTLCSCTLCSYLILCVNTKSVVLYTANFSRGRLLHLDCKMT